MPFDCKALMYKVTLGNTTPEAQKQPVQLSTRNADEINIKLGDANTCGNNLPPVRKIHSKLFQDRYLLPDCCLLISSAFVVLSSCG